MDGYLVHGAIGMSRGSLAHIEDGRGMMVHVWDGELWITQEGDRRDHYVKAGGRLLLDRDGLAIAYALRRAHVTLTAPVPAHYARRITLALGGSAPRVLYERSQERVGWLAGLGHRLMRRWSNAFARRSHPTTAAL